MSSKVKVVLNKNGVKELLQSQEAMAVCEDYANKALSQLGAGYEKSRYVGRKRVNVSIVGTASKKAERENLEKNTILKALGGIK